MTTHKPNRTKHSATLWMDDKAYRIWKSMPRGRRSEEVCKMLRGDEK